MKTKRWTEAHAAAAVARRGKPRKGFAPEWACQRKVIDRYKRRAPLGWNLTNAEAVAIMERNCNYCGVEPKQCTIYKAPYRIVAWKYNGLDRVNNLEGYTVYNTVACCGQCNIAKNDFTLKQFQDWLVRACLYQDLVQVAM